MQTQAPIRLIPSTPATDRVLRAGPAAEFLGLKATTLQWHRGRGTGPRFIKLGSRLVGYRVCDLQAWLEQRVATSISDARDRGISA